MSCINLSAKIVFPVEMHLSSGVENHYVVVWYIVQALRMTEI